MNPIDDRSLALLGEEAFAKVRSAKVAVFGLGGVGGTAFLSLVRSGVGTIYAIDMDVVDATNLNRQLLYRKEEVGLPKAERAKAYALSIREDIRVEAEAYRISRETLADHDYSDCACWIDAIDDIEGKLALMERSIEADVPLLVSLGMGNRLSPDRVELCRLDKSEGDPLAKKLRAECRARGIDMKRFWCAISKEDPRLRSPKPTSLVFTPSAAGLLLASQAIQRIISD